MNIVIITGASSGIGLEFAKQLDHGLFTVDAFWLIARRKEKLEALADTLAHPVKILPLDLQKERDIFTFRQTLAEEKPVIRMLINCAGYGLMGGFETLDLNGQSGEIDLNCKALMQMIHICLPYMKKKSRIIQLASSAAFLPQADFAVYAATKAFVLSFSRALNQELKNRKITVTAVCPGPVNTAFFDIAEKDGSTLALKKRTMVDPDRVVKDALMASAHNRPVAVTGTLIKAFGLAAKLLPHDLLLNITDLLKSAES